MVHVPWVIAGFIDFAGFFALRVAILWAMYLTAPIRCVPQLHRRTDVLTLLLVSRQTRKEGGTRWPKQHLPRSPARKSLGAQQVRNLNSLATQTGLPQGRAVLDALSADITRP
jgi:hypothetical protein